MRGTPYPWPDGKTCAFCFTIDVDAESVYLWLNRDSGSDHLEHMEQRLFGPRTGIWRLLALLKQFDIRATMFVPGVVAERHPELLPAFVAEGHEIALHGYNHELPQDTPRDEFVAALDASIAIFRDQTGITPHGFRAPGAQLTRGMAVELAARGLYDSSLSGADHPYSLDNLTEIPFQWLLDDAVQLKFTGSADKWLPGSPQSVLDSWTTEWRQIRHYNGLLTLTLHDWISGRASNISIVESFLRMVTSDSDVWIATAFDLANHHRRYGRDFAFDIEIAEPIQRAGTAK
ncbi:polysaccharide deacetylase family protein [Novosphingobium piscinae]|uniref:Chitooligosaccharide deacetylase n=1 Tax=Novosphingobium piscinae TaxID=1507448 RepID=A0A7X1FYE8_9SPHN|nr:polysaccharide deacetylase family protein [Novosphingobium piscinae]MBC2669290.1 polysaccharide deacetylase family protein [Novosphingobium piscinae]